MEFIQNIDLLQLLRCFLIGGLLCLIGQFLIDKTKLTPGRSFTNSIKITSKANIIYPN